MIKYFLSILLLSTLSVKAQVCNGWKEGVFKSKSYLGTIFKEIKGEWQIEKSIEFETIYLNKIEYISDCEYIVRYYKVLNKGKIPKPDMNVFALVEVAKNMDSIYQFKVNINNRNTSVFEVEFIKISDSISNEFSEIIKDEELKENSPTTRD